MTTYVDAQGREWIAVPKDPTVEQLVTARDWSFRKYGGQSIGNDAARGCYMAMTVAVPDDCPAVLINKAVLEALRRDAGRYRYLRANCRYGFEDHDGPQLVHRNGETGAHQQTHWRENLDAAVDAEMQLAKEPQP